MPIVTSSEPSETETAEPSAGTNDALRLRYRIRFAKRDLLRWISHRDLARLWERLLRRAQLRLSMTEGFHPKPRIAFPSALALGVEGANEVVEIELAEHWTPADLLNHLRSDEQPGLDIRSVSQLPERFGKAQLLRGIYEIQAPADTDAASVAVAIGQLMDRETVSIERKKKSVEIRLQDQISSLHYTDETLHLVMEASDAASLKPTDVLDLLGFNDWIENGASVVRTDVVLQRELESDDPLVIATASQTE
ncbi:MAG: TIGR03936 family radical SAM-associated protein [Planctomycetota bacterium]